MKNYPPIDEMRMKEMERGKRRYDSTSEEKTKKKFVRVFNFFFGYKKSRPRPLLSTD